MNRTIPQEIVRRQGDGTLISQPLLRADTFFSRLQGLLGRRALAQEEGLLIVPCQDIHTVGMKFPIDVIFLDKALRVVRLHPECRPWRFFHGGKRAKIALEIAAGRIATTNLQVGDALTLDRRARND